MCCSNEIVGSKQDLLVVSNFSDFKVVLDGAEPIIGIQRLDGLSKLGWVGVLKAAEAILWSSSIRLAHSGSYLL